jgi:hypothetical protein
MSSSENQLLTNKNILVYIHEQLTDEPSIGNHGCDSLIHTFCGRVIEDPEPIDGFNKLIYLTGDIQKNIALITVYDFTKMFVIKELSFNYESESNNYKIISIDSVPVNMYNTGVFFKKLFDSDSDYFDLLTNEHKYQSLSESNKPGEAYRTGIYLCNVQSDEQEVHFNLLRCSTNLNGPTEGFQKTDKTVVSTVNEISKYFFSEPVELNHVLAQVYNNVKLNNKDRKAKIKEHSDKTKDMPANALMAFCTFYNRPVDNINELTKLRFRLKTCVSEPGWVKNFDILLHPGSVFLMSLKTNRLYTHEIVPSLMPIEKIPTRLGYVIRCSKTKAVHKNGKTFIIEQDPSGCMQEIELREPTSEEFKQLKDLYYQENLTDQIMEYSDVHFTFNKGDFMKPI